MSLLTVEGIFLAVSRVILRTLDEWKCFRCLESDLVESCRFGQGRIQIPSLACLFDSVIWSE